MNVQGVNTLITAPLQAQAANTTAASGTGGSSSTDGTSSSDLQTMFLNLLVTELQNQDPTQPVDPTEMVGQMISLNQLDQLISINQTLSSLNGSQTTSGSAAPVQGGGSGASTIVTHGINGAAPPQASAPAAPLAFQFPANTSVPVLGSAVNLYNMYGNVGAAGPVLNRFTPLGGK